MEGWVKIYRKMLSWEWFGDANTLQVFLYLLLNAALEDTRNKGSEIKRGQVITSISQIAETTRLSTRQIRTALAHLKSTGELTYKSTNKFSVVTICRFDDYQSKQQPERQAEGQTTGQSTDKQDNLPPPLPPPSYKEEDKEEKKGAPAPARAKTLEERREEFRKEVMSFSEKYETQMLENFIDYWTECNDSGKKMKWEMTKAKGGTFCITNRLAYWDSRNVERGGKSSKKGKQRKDPTPSDVLGPAYDEWMKTRGGQLFSEQFK